MRPNILLGLLCLTSAAAAQPAKLKVYISVDMEGIAGVVASHQTGPGGHEYGWARRLMTAEANAAIVAAFEAGATEVVVNDSHGSQTNLPADEIDRRASLITGQPKPFGMTQGLDSTFDAAIYIGYHAHGSEAASVLGHTFSGALKHVRINGQEVGEYGLNGMVAGHFGVPVVLISGDDKIAAEARAFFPGIETVIVKQGIAMSAARTLHPQEARSRIAAGVKAALGRRSSIRPNRLTTPITLEIELSQMAYADAAANIPGMVRVDGLTVRYVAPDALTAYRVARVIMALARD
ncbi:MAG TPA: M55 family metallopeptidase [Gemmatimonadaceae bacterium]|nr:M55 family metallopeptidase [Gemmatimonadaceae bacterium]